MKKQKILILSTLIFLISSSLFAQTSALDELLKERSDSIRESEQNSDSLKRLNDEKRLLINKLVDVNKQYDDIIKTQNLKKESDLFSISVNEISRYILNKKMGRCKITAGEYLGEYIIKKDKVTIRFAFLPKDSLLAPKLSLVKGEQNEDVFQIEQPGYNPNSINAKGEISATLRFLIKSENNTPGEIIHAVFMGQLLNDGWFGKSSLALTNITCVLGS